MARKRLLVIDDHPEFSELIRDLSEGLGYEVTVTSRAREFKAAFKKTQPTTIVLDIVMPKVDGIELVQWLAKQKCRSKVVVVTGFNPQYAKAAQLIGSDKGLSVTTVQKPAGIDTLRSILDPDGPLN